MSLVRGNTCRHFMTADNIFVKCYTKYSAKFNDGQGAPWSTTFEIAVLPNMLPDNQQAAPTDAQVHAVADPLATTKYTNWCAALAGEKPVQSNHPGQAGTIA